MVLNQVIKLRLLNYNQIQSKKKIKQINVNVDINFIYFIFNIFNIYYYNEKKIYITINKKD